MRATLLAMCGVLGACGGHDPVAADAVGTGIDSPPPSCPAPFTEDAADHSSIAQVFASPSSARGTSILVLGMPDGAGGYASLNGLFSVTGLPPGKRMNLSLVMGTACTPACSPTVELRAGMHPNFALLGDDQSSGCRSSDSSSTTSAGELPLWALSTNDGPNYGYLIQIP